MVVFNLK